ncbi:hypothetical protein JT359_05315 [Candidatus Poribacteria bacterium]|nr:hypothetical protein [Candidatus Poribacteria bacterium]
MANENEVNENAEVINGNTPQSGIVFNVQQVQSIDITNSFNHVKTENGWVIQILESGKLSINFITSMRKTETTVMAGDYIERDGDDIILYKHQTEDVYRQQRSPSSLSRSRDELLASETAIKPVEIQGQS